MSASADRQLQVTVAHSVTSHPISPSGTPDDTPEGSRRATAAGDYEAGPSTSGQPPTITQITSAFASLSKSQSSNGSARGWGSDNLGSSSAFAARPSAEATLDFRDALRPADGKDLSLDVLKRAELQPTSSGEANEIKAAASTSSLGADGGSARASPLVRPTDLVTAHFVVHIRCWYSQNSTLKEQC